MHYRPDVPRQTLTAVLPLALSLLASAVSGQLVDHVNIYRYILDMDVPESPALIGLDAATSRVTRGSMPKPVGASLLHRWEDGRWEAAMSLDVAPYYVLGGGVRTMAAHRDMSVRGRLMRVLTKTIVSVGGIPDASDATSHILGFGIRSTLHDPHDPVTGSRLVALVDSTLAAAGRPPLAETDEDLRGLDPDLRALFAAARRETRARAGDVQVAAGWGVARPFTGSGAGADEAGPTRHTLWLSAQHTRGPRIDVLATVQLLDAFDVNRKVRIGAGIQRKAAATDFRTELYYDHSDRRLHPGMAIESHVAPGLGVVAAVTDEPRAPGQSSRLRLSTMARWYFVSRH